jgi:hypothetical protein
LLFRENLAPTMSLRPAVFVGGGWHGKCCGGSGSIRNRAEMSSEEIVERIQEIETLVREHRYELALALTARLEDALAALPPQNWPGAGAVRDLLLVSRLLTETLIRLQGLRVH